MSRDQGFLGLIKAPATKENHPELNLYSRAAKAEVGHKAKMLVGPVNFKVGESMTRSTWLRTA